MFNTPIARHLFDLPLLVLEKILKSLTPRDLISFSFASILATKIVKSARPKVDKIYIEFGRNRVTIGLENVKKGHSTYAGAFRFFNTGDLYVSDVVYSSRYILGGGLSTLNFSDDIKMVETLLVSHCLQQHMHAVKASLDHICDIYRSSVKRVSVDTNANPNFSGFFIWKHLKKCEDVQFLGDTISSCQINWALKTLKVKQGLQVGRQFMKKDLHCDVSRHIKEIRNLRYLALHSAHWYSNHHFLSMNNRVLLVESSKITSAGINKWLKIWMTLTHDRTIALMLHSGRVFSKNVVLEGLPWIDEDEVPDQKHLNLGTFFPLCTKGAIQITREDGAVAHLDFDHVDLHIYIRYPGYNFET